MYFLFGVASALQLSMNMLDRRQMGAAVTSALGIQVANAGAGESPKFSFFGIAGNAGTYSEGAAYGIDSPDRDNYSPYSPYQAVGTGVYKKGSAEEVAFKKKLFAESKGRVAKVSKYIEKKQWEEVRSELERQVYSMRSTMNYLATGKPEAVAAAKKFYMDLEAVNLLSKRKKQDAALDAYKDMMASLDLYTKLI